MTAKTNGNREKIDFSNKEEPRKPGTSHDFKSIEIVTQKGDILW